MIENADAEMLRSQAPAAKQTQPECDTQDKEQFPDLSAGGDTVETPPEQKWQTVQSKADVKREQAKAGYIPLSVPKPPSRRIQDDLANMYLTTKAAESPQPAPLVRYQGVEYRFNRNTGKYERR